MTETLNNRIDKTRRSKMTVRESREDKDLYHVLPQFFSPYRNGICWMVGERVRRADFLRMSMRVNEFRRCSLKLVFIPDEDVADFEELIGELSS